MDRPGNSDGGAGGSTDTGTDTGGETATDSDTGGGGAASTGEGGSGVGGGGSAVSIACQSFCAEVAPLGCPKTADCQSWCPWLFQDPCVPEMTAAIECAPMLFAADCTMGYSTDEEYECITRLDAVIDCSFDAWGCHDGWADMAPSGFCAGGVQCGADELEANCDPDGSCACYRNGDYLGTCHNVMTELSFCIPTVGCCAAILPH